MKTIKVEIVTPEAMMYTADAVMVVTELVDGGEIAFQVGHTPFLGAIDSNHTRIHLPDGRVDGVAVHGGFVEVNGKRVSIRADIAELQADVDVERAKRALAKAEEAIAEQRTEEAVDARRRAKSRLSVKGIR